MIAKMKVSPAAPAADSIVAAGGSARTTPSVLKTKGRAHYDETMKIAGRIMDERDELFRRLADA